MTLLSWVILLAMSAVLATAAQYLFFHHDRKSTDYDWVFIAGGALPGAVVLGTVVEVIYRAFLRPRQHA
jgi:hypothetical protein